MNFDKLRAKDTNGWITQVKTALVRNIVNSFGEVIEINVVDIIPHIESELTLSERLLLIQTGLVIKQVVKIKNRYVAINETDHILVFGTDSTSLLYKTGTPFFVMTNRDYEGKFYSAKYEDLYKEYYK